MDLSTLVTVLGLRCALAVSEWKWDLASQGQMMPEEPSLEVLGQQERKPILLHPVLFLGGM